MSLYLKILNGDLAGNSIKLKKGFTIGRSKADLILKDPKISATHARVEGATEGSYVLVDLKSTNGIDVNGKKEKKLDLKKGAKFRLGGVEFEVVTQIDAEKKESVVIKAWQEPLYDFLENLNLIPREKMVHAFPLIIVLEFIEGFQKNTKWLVGYGPRSFGPGHGEFPILEPVAPNTCFTIDLSAQDMIVKTDYPTQVLLNGQSKKTEKIHDGLLIEIQNTKIRVSFHHETVP